MRLVVAGRLSQLSEDQTGLDSQEREVLAWADRHGHEVVGIALDYKSGKTHLWDRPSLRPWVTLSEKIAQYDAIAALKVDRLTRADDEGVDALKAWARKHHKSILISSADVSFPSEGVEGVRWDLYIRMAHQEWLDIRERYGRMQQSRHRDNSAIGRPPWGYEIVRADGVKTFEPTTIGRLWVPRIFGWVAAGESARDIARRLEAEGLRPVPHRPSVRWHEARIISMIKVPTYSGTRVRKGHPALQVEPLVSRALQDKAVAKLAERARVGRGGTQPKALLAKLKCGHPDCPGRGEWPMYRIGNRYYRCMGKGAQRKGCGAPMIDRTTLDNLVITMNEYWDSRPYVTQRYVSGNDAGVRLDNLRSEMSEAVRVAPADRIATVVAEYASKIAALEAEGSVQPHWESVETGQTEGEYLRGLDLDRQREYLGRKDIRAWKLPNGTICVTVDGALARTGGPSIIAEHM